ncbi:MAG: DUF1015 domain-containing protein [Tepidisphaeraceae bacterium]
MPQVRPFYGIRYARNKGFDFSDLIAPPYDVLEDSAKAALQARHPNNIVTIDLPHLPAKSVGPDEAYAGSAVTLQAWLSAGILAKDAKAAFYPYAQTYVHNGRTFHRRGFLALVRLSPFGQGQVVPHEKTYPDAIHDRLKLTRATHMQLSPIFGLFSDPRGQTTAALYKNLGRPEMSAMLGDVRNDLWSVTDSECENIVIDYMSQRPVYIADGHHRYTMALQYQREAIEKAGGSLPPNHPANFCLFVLVPMQDDGLLILPTHRLIGNIPSFDAAEFERAIAPVATFSQVPISESKLPEYIDAVLPKQPPGTFGLFDGRTRKTWQITFTNPDVLANLEPGHSPAWRKLDVAVLQRYLLDEVLKPKFAGGQDPARGYTADSDAVAKMTDGKKYQIALLLKSTALHALEELGKTNEVMPPKSTYFFPKLATGMVLNPLE